MIDHSSGKKLYGCLARMKRERRKEMRKYFVFLAVWFLVWISSFAQGDRFIIMKKVFIPTTEKVLFSPLLNFKVNCVGGGCNGDFIKESAPLIQEFMTEIHRYFHLEKSSFKIRVVSHEYFKQVTEKFPRKKKFLFLGKKKIGAVMQGGEGHWMITLPRFSSYEDLQTIWIGMIKASDKDRFGKEFIGDKEAGRIVQKIFGQTQFVTPDMVVQ